MYILFFSFLSFFFFFFFLLFSAFEIHRHNTNQEFMSCLMSESSDGIFSKSHLGKPCFFMVPYICPTIKSSKRVCLITLGNYRFFLQHSCGWRVNFPRETVNVIEVSAVGIFGLQRLWEQQVVPQPVMEVSFSLM